MKSTENIKCRHLSDWTKPLTEITVTPFIFIIIYFHSFIGFIIWTISEFAYHIISELEHFVLWFQKCTTFNLFQRMVPTTHSIYPKHTNRIDCAYMQMKNTQFPTFDFFVLMSNHSHAILVKVSPYFHEFVCFFFYSVLRFDIRFSFVYVNPESQSKSWLNWL